MQVDTQVNGDWVAFRADQAAFLVLSPSERQHRVCCTMYNRCFSRWRGDRVSGFACQLYAISVQLCPIPASAGIMPRKLTRLFSSVDDSSCSSDTSDSSSELWARTAVGRCSLLGDNNSSHDDEYPRNIALPGLVAALRASRARSSAAQAKASR